MKILSVVNQIISGNDIEVFVRGRGDGKIEKSVFLEIKEGVFMD